MPWSWSFPAAPVATRLLLGPAPGLIDGLGAELHDVKGVEHGGSVFQPFVDGVRVAVEQLQGGDFHGAAGDLAALLEPAAIGLSGPPWHQVHQPCPRACRRHRE